MKLGRPQGGRPPYALEDADIKLAYKLAKNGLTLENISNALGVCRETLYNLMERDRDFFNAIKRGRAEEYLECNELVKEGELSPTAFIFFCKTKYKNFYEKEDKEEPKQEAADLSHLTDEELEIISKIINKPKERD